MFAEISSRIRMSPGPIRTVCLYKFITSKRGTPEQIYDKIIKEIGGRKRHSPSGLMVKRVTSNDEIQCSIHCLGIV